MAMHTLSDAVIRRPRIDQIEPGMMVRAKYGKDHNWGQMVEAVDPKGGRVLVRHYIGGQRECMFWIPVKDVKKVWSIGTYEEANRLIALFHIAIHRILATASHA
jgi:hypothetical protein